MVVYTPTPSRGISHEVRKEYSKKDHRIETTMDGHMTIHRFSLIGEGRNPLIRAFRYFAQNIKQFNRAVFGKDARRCNLMLIASTPPTQGAMAALIKKCRHIPLIYNLQDIFPDSLVGAGMTREGSFLWKIGRRIEDFTYRNADKIVVISEEFKRNIMAKGVPESKIEVIYNWVDEDSVYPVAKEDNPLIEEFGVDPNKFTVVYAGNLGSAQNIDIIIAAAKELPGIQFLIFGKGGLEVTIRNRIMEDSLNNVLLLPIQPLERVRYVYSLGDACVVSCKSGLGGSAMPSKTWNIMCCGRPVIASFDEGELKSILENKDCGVFSHAGNVTEFVNAIQFLAKNPSRCKEMGDKARHLILQEYTKELGTQRYVDLIKSLKYES